jgi:hypothetical protein
LNCKQDNDASSQLIKCWKCGTSYQVPEHLEGTKARCKGCQSVIVLSTGPSRMAALLRGPSGRPPPAARERGPEPGPVAGGPPEPKGRGRNPTDFIIIGVVIYLLCFPIAMKLSPNFQGLFQRTSIVAGWILSLVFLLKGLRLSFEAKGSATWWAVLTCAVAALLSPILALIMAALSPDRRKARSRETGLPSSGR